MRDKRTEIDFGKHECHVTKNDDLLIHHLKVLGTIEHNIKFINTNDLLIIKGDFGNWLFCREFHPSKEGGVSDSYWLGELHNSSSQNGLEFDSETTKGWLNKELNGELVESGYEGYALEGVKKFYERLLFNVDMGESDYKAVMLEYPENLIDADEIPYVEKTKFRLEVIFDAFDDICMRMKDGRLTEIK